MLRMLHVGKISDKSCYFPKLELSHRRGSDFLYAISELLTGGKRRLILRLGTETVPCWGKMRVLDEGRNQWGTPSNANVTTSTCKEATIGGKRDSCGAISLDLQEKFGIPGIPDEELAFEGHCKSGERGKEQSLY